MTIWRRPIPAMHWLMSLAHMAPAHVSPWLAVRAAIAIGLPATIGLAVGQPHIAALVAIGALPAITGDKGGPYRERAISIGSTVLGGVLGYYLGVLLFGHGWLTLFGLLILVLGASLIGTFNGIAAAATLKFSVYAIVGASLEVAIPGAERAELVGLGGLFGLVLTLSGWLFTPTAPERGSLASIYRKLADLLATINTPQSAAARRNMEATVSSAYDTLWAERSTHGASRRLAQLAVQLQACTPVIDTCLALIHAGQPLHPEAMQTLRAIADRVERGHAIDLPKAIAHLRGLGCDELAEALQQAQDVMASAPGAAVDALGPQQPSQPLRSHLKIPKPSADVRRYLLRLGLCLIVAELVLRVFALPRSYWVPLIVVVMFKSNFGSVYGRALQSCLGSLVGVGISIIVLKFDNNGITSLIAIIVLASLLPWAIRRNYGLFTAIWLPILMLLVGGLQKATSWPIAEARALDVCIATVIVVFIGYLPWIRFERTSLDQAVSGAIDAIAKYLEGVFVADDATRHRLHSAAYSKLTNLRGVLDRAEPEPELVSRRAMAWWPVEAALEQIANAVSDVGWKRARNAEALAPVDTAPLVSALRSMGEVVDEGGTVPDQPVTAPSPALQGVAEAIEGLRSTLRGPMAETN